MATWFKGQTQPQICCEFSSCNVKHIICCSVFQELPKYLSGYHVSTKEEVVNIAALLLRIKIKNDKSQLDMISRMLKELVPVDQLKTMSENEWKKVRGFTALITERIKMALIFFFWL